MQYEGGVLEGGRGPSIWDTFTHQHPGMFLSPSQANMFLNLVFRFAHIKEIARFIELDYCCGLARKLTFDVVYGHIRGNLYSPIELE